MRITLAIGAALAVASYCAHANPVADAPSNSPKTAHASLAPTQGNQAKGDIALEAVDGGVHLSGRLTGLKPGAEHGFHVHEKGDCSAADASSAGAHFNPGASPHGNPAASQHHAGDMANVRADDKGMASVDVTLGGVSLGNANDIVGKALVLHADPDDYSTQPSGNSGARIACGVIVK